MRYGIASVWLFHGLFGKVLGLIPRHRLIVARVLGEDVSGAATRAIGIAEILLALWVASGRFPRLCAAAITLALAAMNTLEVLYARDLLLAPAGMVAANAALVGVAWYLAIADRPREDAAAPRDGAS